MPLGDGVKAYLYGSATGIWNVNWITFWGVMLFNTLVMTGVFDKFRRWLIAQGTQDVRVQRSFSPGHSGRCWKDWWGSAIRGRSSLPS
jgi:L-lactate permease